MKIILNKIYLHPFFLITVILFILIGRFKMLSYFMLLILIHEFGHVIVAIYFNWSIEKIIILPFGGLTKFNELINRPLKEKFLVSIMGIIFQIIFYFLIKNKISYKYFDLINNFIIIFNLIPIYPLDGSKILNVVFNKLFSFKFSNLLNIYLSYILIFILFIISFKINKLFILIYLFLLIEVMRLNKNKEYIFNKFLLERYLNNFNFKKRKIVNNINKMKMDYKHLFLVKNSYITEKEKLKKMFDNNNDL